MWHIFTKIECRVSQWHARGSLRVSGKTLYVEQTKNTSDQVGYNGMEYNFVYFYQKLTFYCCTILKLSIQHKRLLDLDKN